MLAKLNLVWRVVGGNALLIAIGLLFESMNQQVADYLVITNLLITSLVTFHIIRRDLTLKSNVSDIFTTFVICRFAVDICNIRTEMECLIAVTSTVIAVLWMYKFFILKIIRS